MQINWLDYYFSYIFSWLEVYSFFVMYGALNLKKNTKPVRTRTNKQNLLPLTEYYTIVKWISHQQVLIIQSLDNLTEVVRYSTVSQCEMIWLRVLSRRTEKKDRSFVPPVNLKTILPDIRYISYSRNALHFFKVTHCSKLTAKNRFMSCHMALTYFGYWHCVQRLAYFGNW